MIYFVLFLNYYMLIILMLISVAYFTILERKVLGYVQERKGPNKVGFLGIFQPFSDAIKLFMKEFFYIMKSNYIYFYLSPIMAMFLMLTMWMFFPFGMKMFINMELSILVLLCLMSMNSYIVLMSGWSSKSNYPMLGMMRGVAQIISYEVGLIFMFFGMIMMIESFNLFMFMKYQYNFNCFIYMFYLVMLMLILSFMAELNRVPFDFIEGESELVSGFNTEYFGVGFAMLFLSEYMSIIFFSIILIEMFIGKVYILLYMFMSLILMMLVILIRGAYPRYRYDKLMQLSWDLILPYSMLFLFLVMMFKLILFSYMI